MRPAGSAQGFTLIEVLLAVTLFALLAAAVYGSLNMLSDTAFTQRQRSAELANLQRAVARLDADLRQLATRPVRAADGESLPSLVGRHDRIEATRSGWTNPLQQPRSELQRFVWSADGERLIRSHWPVTDPTPVTPRLDEPVLDQVGGLRFAYLGSAGQWLDLWPEEGAVDELPRALRYRFDSHRFGSIERIIVLP